MSDDFRVALVSNSSTDFFPKNTVSSFVTKLPKALEFDRPFVVGLSDIFYPLSISNIQKNVRVLIFYAEVAGFRLKNIRNITGSTDTQIFLKAGHYESMDDLISEINNCITGVWQKRTDLRVATDTQIPKFSLDNSKKVKLRYGYLADRAIVVYPQFVMNNVDSIEDMLGFIHGQIGQIGQKRKQCLPESQI